jgi:hypothetical protein
MRRSAKKIAKRQPAEARKNRTHKPHRIVRAAAANTGERISGPRQDTQPGLSIVSENTHHVADQVIQGFGLSVEKGEAWTLRSVQNMEAVTQASMALSRGFQELSLELVTAVQEQVKRNLNVLRDLSRCRSVQEFVSIQSELLRDNIQHTLQGTQRLAEVSTRIADEATHFVTQRSSGNLQNRADSKVS